MLMFHDDLLKRTPYMPGRVFHEEYFLPRQVRKYELVIMGQLQKHDMKRMCRAAVHYH
jgi:hypothetical protein